MIAQFKSAYSPSLIYRNTNWIWHAGKPVYLLREPERRGLGPAGVHEGGRSEPRPPTTSTSWASKYKNLPEGWTFETKMLTEELSLDTGRAGGWAAIIRDEFGCTYQGCGYGTDTSANYVP